MFPTTSGEGYPGGWRPDWRHLSLLLGGLLVVYYVLPLLTLVSGASPRTLLASATEPTVRNAATTSVLASLASTLVAGVFGVPLAYWLARTDGRLGRALLVLVVVPLVLPPVVSGMLLVGVVGRGGALGGLTLTGSLPGVVLAQTFVASPLVVVTARSAFRGVDADLRNAARVLGCSRWESFRHVALPIAWPGILAGFALAFARAMGEFGATMLVAYYPRTLPVQVWVSFQSAGVDAAFPVAVVLVVVSLAALALVSVLGVLPRG